MIEKIKQWAGVVALVAIVLFMGFSAAPMPNLGTNGSCNGGKCTDYDAVDVTDGYYVDGTAVFTGAGVLTGTTGSFSGLLTLNGGLLRSSAIATSTTATTQTLVQADILSYDTILLTPNTGDLTLTWPATSTLTSLVPTAGDMAEQCIHNATSTAGIDITVAAGTGIDLEFASSTVLGPAASLTITAGNTGCFTYIRKTNTDIVALFERFVDGD